MGFTVKTFLRRVLRRVSEKGVSRRCLECTLGEYDQLGVHPKSRDRVSFVKGGWLSTDWRSQSVPVIVNVWVEPLRVIG